MTAAPFVATIRIPIVVLAILLTSAHPNIAPDAYTTALLGNRPAETGA